MKKQCSNFVHLITAYIDQELESQQMYEVENHLKCCPECDNACASEQAIKSLLKDRIRVSGAPTHLQQRIRHRLARDEGRPGFWQVVSSLFETRPVPSVLVLTLVLAMIILPAYRLVQAVGFDSILSSRNIVEDANVTGEVLCLDCEFISKSNPKGKHDASHRLGLKENERSVWTFLHTENAERLLRDSSLLQKRVSIHGTLFMNSKYIYVKEYQVL